jgi:endonuclease/exonuclease/phosphatase family metal-dependent hydrolase
LTLAASWAYAISVLALWVLLRVLGDRWWLATILLYGPRWLTMLPLALLVPVAAVVNRRTLVPLFAGLVLCVFPLMGFCIPWRSWIPSGTENGLRIRILSCNVHYANVHPDRLFDLIASERPDIVALQEWSSRHDLPTAKLGPGVHINIQNTTCLISRFPIEAVESLDRAQMGGKGDAIHYVLKVTGGPLHFFNLHPISPRNGLQAVIDHPLHAAAKVRANSELRAREAAATSRWAGRAQGRVLVSGDLNLPSDSPIFQESWSHYTDAFAASGFGFGYTWFSRWHGLRIDHILGGAGWRCRRSWVGPDIGSDHRPLLADVEWIGDPG